MKQILLMSAILIVINTSAQTYGSMDLGLTHRTQPIMKDDKIYTIEKPNTAVLSVNMGYMLHMESDNGAFNLFTEINARLPLLDNTNSVSAGIRTGPAIPVGNIYLVPMGGIYYNVVGTAGKAFTTGGVLKAVFTAKEFDCNWYIEASYVNKMAGVGIGLIIRNNRLL